MTTVALIRTNYVDAYLRRADLDTVPWTDGQIDRATVDALTALWPDGIGKRGSGTVNASQASDVYTIPLVAGVPIRISKIDFVQTSGGVTQRVGRITSWEYVDDTTFRVSPMLPTVSGLVLRVAGWIPFLTDASDLPVRLESVVAMKSTALCYGQEAGQLAQSQTQQGLDSGRVVDYPTVVGLSAYWERRYRDALDGDQNMKSYAPRHAYR